jgi:chromosome segregation ATPase
MLLEPKKARSLLKRSLLHRTWICKLACARSRTLSYYSLQGGHSSTQERPFTSPNSHTSPSTPELKKTKQQVRWWQRAAQKARSEGALQAEALDASQQQLGDAQQELSHAKQQVGLLQSGTAVLQHDLSVQKTQSTSLKRRVEDLEEQHEQDQEEIQKLTNSLEKVKKRRTVLQSERDALKKCTLRFPDRLKRTAQKAGASAADTARTVSMKAKGAFTEKFRALYRALIDRGVANEHVDGVIHDVADSVGVKVAEHVSARSVSRANAESYIHAQIQIATEISEADSKTAKLYS